jgi:DNA-binding protein H-NS
MSSPRSAKRAELESQLAALGYAAPKKRGRPRATANGSGNGAMLRKGRKGKVKAKYRDSKTGETWSGRGRMASWLKSKQDAGESIEKYLV